MNEASRWLGVLCTAAVLHPCFGCISEKRPDRRQAGEKAALKECPLAAAVDHDVTLTKACSPYLQPRGGVDIIEGATLTIEAGVELRFLNLDWLEVGAGGKPGRLIAKGTEAEPIIFTAVSPGEAPDWTGVWFHSGTLAGSVLSHAVIRRAGGFNRHSKPNLFQGCLTLTGVQPGVLSIDHVRLESCVNGGMRLINSQVKLSAISFVASDQGFVADPASLGQITEAAQYSGVPGNLLLDGTLAADARWIPQALPYLVDGHVKVQGESSPTLSIAAGTELRFTKSSDLVVGEDAPGALHIEGTPEAPVKLGAQKPAEPWAGVRLGKQTAAGTRVSHAEIRQTAGGAALTLASQAGRVEVSNSTFADNATDVAVECGVEPVLSNNHYGSKLGLSRKAPCTAAKAR